MSFGSLDHPLPPTRLREFKNLPSVTQLLTSRAKQLVLISKSLNMGLSYVLLRSPVIEWAPGHCGCNMWFIRSCGCPCWFLPPALLTPPLWVSQKSVQLTLPDAQMAPWSSPEPDQWDQVTASASLFLPLLLTQTPACESFCQAQRQSRTDRGVGGNPAQVTAKSLNHSNLFALSRVCPALTWKLCLLNANDLDTWYHYARASLLAQQ